MGAPIVTAIRAPSPDIDNHQTVLTQLKEETELGRRIRGNPSNSFVTLGELISAGIVKFISGVVSPGPKIANSSGGGLTSVSVVDSITGTGVVATPLKLVGDVASPTASQYYGTNAGATRGWYNLPGGGGGSQPFNVTQDTHGSIPTGVGLGPNDEFEGLTLDTAGTRYAGATAWTMRNASTGTYVLDQGALLLSAAVGASTGMTSAMQPLPGGGAWRYRTKDTILMPAATNDSGMVLNETATGKQTRMTFYTPGGGAVHVQVYNFTGFTTAVSAVSDTAVSWPYFGNAIPPVYFEIELAAGTLFFRYSASGYDGTFITAASVAVNAYFTTAPDEIGVFAEANNVSTTCVGMFDWFRRMA